MGTKMIFKEIVHALFLFSMTSSATTSSESKLIFYPNAIHYTSSLIKSRNQPVELKTNLGKLAQYTPIRLLGLVF